MAAIGLRAGFAHHTVEVGRCVPQPPVGCHPSIMMLRVFFRLLRSFDEHLVALDDDVDY